MACSSLHERNKVYNAKKDFTKFHYLVINLKYRTTGVT